MGSPCFSCLQSASPLAYALVLLNITIMRRAAPLSRTSITLPQPQLAAADQIAAQLDRSRSWVFAEAIRRWANRLPTLDPVTGPQETEVAPSAAQPPRIAPATALKLSPTARLRMAQDLVGALRREHPRPTRLQIIAFESQQDFHSWKAVQ